VDVSRSPTPFFSYAKSRSHPQPCLGKLAITWPQAVLSEEDCLSEAAQVHGGVGLTATIYQTSSIHGIGWIFISRSSQ
jgi:hypothetical protein